MNNFIMTYLMTLTKNQFFIAKFLLIGLYLVPFLMLVSTIGFAIYSNILNTDFSRKIKLLSGVSGLLALSLMAPFIHFIRNTNIENHTKNLNQKYYFVEIFEPDKFGFFLYKKLENENISSQVSIVDKNQFLGELKCGDLSLRECFNQVQTASISSNDSNNVIFVSKNNE